MLQLDNNERIFLRSLPVCREAARAVGEAAPEAAAPIPLRRIAARGHRPPRVGGVHHHRHDDPCRREVDHALDLRVVAGGHAVEARAVRPLHGHQMRHRAEAVHLAVLAVDPHEVEPGLRRQLRHRRIGERHHRAKRHFAAARLCEKLFKVVDLHFRFLSMP